MLSCKGQVDQKGKNEKFYKFDRKTHRSVVESAGETWKTGVSMVEYCDALRRRKNRNSGANLECGFQATFSCGYQAGGSVNFGRVCVTTFTFDIFVFPRTAFALDHTYRNR